MHHIDRIKKLGDQGGTDSIERVGLDERHSMVEHVSERLDELAVLESHLFDPGYDDMIGRDLFADWGGAERWHHSAEDPAVWRLRMPVRAPTSPEPLRIARQRQVSSRTQSLMLRNASRSWTTETIKFSGEDETGLGILRGRPVGILGQVRAKFVDLSYQTVR